jgi:hypothetical protein
MAETSFTCTLYAVMTATHSANSRTRFFTHPERSEGCFSLWLCARAREGRSVWRSLRGPHEESDCGDVALSFALSPN